MLCVCVYICWPRVHEDHRKGGSMIFCELLGHKLIFSLSSLPSSQLLNGNKSAIKLSIVQWPYRSLNSLSGADWYEPCMPRQGQSIAVLKLKSFAFCIPIQCPFCTEVSMSFLFVLGLMAVMRLSLTVSSKQASSSDCAQLFYHKLTNCKKKQQMILRMAFKLSPFHCFWLHIQFSR